MHGKKDNILATALDLFISQGYENTPTSQISNNANVATGTLFHHFKNKQQLLDYLYITCKLSLKSHLVKNLETTLANKGKLYVIWQNYIDWAKENRKEFMFLHKYSEHPAISQSARNEVDNTYESLINLLQNCYEEGVLAKLPFDYIVILTKLHFAAAVDYIAKHPEILDKKKMPKRLFDSYWQSIKN